MHSRNRKALSARRSIPILTAIAAGLAFTFSFAHADNPSINNPQSAIKNGVEHHPPHPPNIIFILTDDMRWDAMGCMDQPKLRTPNLDRLARDGVLFPNAFCTTSICATNRTCILTGQYARRHGVVNFSTSLTTEAMSRTYPAILRRAGYRTAFIGKWGLGDPLPKNEFDVWHGYSGQGRYFEDDRKEHLTSVMRRQATDFLNNLDSAQPFLLCVQTKAPHAQDNALHQFQYDPKYKGLYADVNFETPAAATVQAYEQLPDFIRNSEGRIRWERRFADPEMFQNSVRDYHRLIAGVDELVGAVLKSLEENGLGKNTVIVFTSDNGFFLGEHGMAGKWLMYEESIRVPLIFYDPRLPNRLRGTRPDAMVLSIDIAPTLCTLAGAGPDKRMQGRSLMPVILGKADTWRTDWFYEHLYGHGGRIPRTEGVRTERWKYVHYLDTDPLFEQLFDLTHDPHELNNLAGDPVHENTLRELRTRWENLRAQCQ